MEIRCLTCRCSNLWDVRKNIVGHKLCVLNMQPAGLQNRTNISPGTRKASSINSLRSTTSYEQTLCHQKTLRVCNGPQHATRASCVYRRKQAMWLGTQLPSVDGPCRARLGLHVHVPDLCVLKLSTKQGRQCMLCPVWQAQPSNTPQTIYLLCRLHVTNLQLCACCSANMTTEQWLR